jgi:uncharacterized protein
MLPLVLLLNISSLSSASFKADDIMKKNEEARKISSVKATGKIITDGGSRKRLEKTFTWWRQLQKDGVHFNTLTIFHTPANVKDQAILFLEAASEKNEILMWLPTFKKTRIIESSQQNSSFMGSDFSFSDITALQNEDYKYQAMGIENCPNMTQLKCYKIEAVLKNSQSSSRLGYSKLMLWMRQDNHMTDRVHYYDLSGKLFKELNTTKIQKVGNNLYFSEYLEMKNLTNQQFTTIEFSAVDAKTPIPDKTFFKQRLGQK